MNGLKRYLALALVAGVLGGCAPTIEPIRSSSEDKVPLSVTAVPPQILGFPVSQEQIGETLEEAKRAHYVDATALFSIRKEDDELQATLQISRFHPDPEFATRDFRRSIVSQIGATQPRVLRAEDLPVYLTSAKGLRIAIWFRQRHMFVLSIREEFDRPKSLMRASLEVIP